MCVKRLKSKTVSNTPKLSIDAKAVNISTQGGRAKRR
jgi:hypothetical protein